MAKSFKLRLWRAIPTFQFCRSKDPSTLPEDPVPPFFRQLPPPPPASSRPPPRRSSFKHHVSSTLASAGCSLLSASDARRPSEDCPANSLYFKSQKDDGWHHVAQTHDDLPRRKVCNSSVSWDSADNVDVPTLPQSSPAQPPAAEKKKRRSRKKRNAPRVRLSTSSADSGWFSSDGGGPGAIKKIDDEETETLVSSSRSLTTDSSPEFNPPLETIRENPFPKKKKKRTRKVKRTKVRGMCRLSISSSQECVSPARLSSVLFQKTATCGVEGKVRESFAVVKKSADPYEDFKRSMMEMIMENQLFEREDMEQLLQCFLSLNSNRHHGAIVKAFSEIWEAMFCSNDSSGHH